MLKKILIFFVLLVILFKANESTDFVMNTSLQNSIYYYIQTSAELSKGILFTNSTGANQNVQYMLVSGTTNNNAVWNYNNSNGKTEYWVYAYIQGAEISVCHGATNHLCSNPGCIGIDNYLININNAKWSKSETNDLNNPSISNSIPFVIGFDNQNKIIQNSDVPKTIYFRYWLDVPPNSPPYIFNTTYQIIGVVDNEC
ncbi:MAG: hypothetical protein N3D75_04340 [Candidatus Aenigmarchaeota archaeon]|nr:hypothetical protein [Candidatus Aenigmarchaeota archaeon]